MNDNQQQEVLIKVSEWLEMIGKSREWLADQMGVSIGTVNGWYSPGSKRPVPNPSVKLMQHLIQDNELGDPKFTFPETLVIQRAMKAADYISFPEFAHDAVIAKANAILLHEAAAGDLIRKPTLPDRGKEILTIDQGRKLLGAVESDARLKTYLLIAGWLGLRPSECQRLRWGAFDWGRGYLHLTPEVAGKTSSERYVPLDARVGALLKGIFEGSGKKPGTKVCVFRSREYLSLLAREKGVLVVWPPDVLRHSFCSYRIAIVKSLETVALEAGNSPAILKSNYRKPLREEDGLAWWGLLEEERGTE